MHDMEFKHTQILPIVFNDELNKIICTKDNDIELIDCDNEAVIYETVMKYFQAKDIILSTEKWSVCVILKEVAFEKQIIVMKSILDTNISSYKFTDFESIKHELKPTWYWLIHMCRDFAIRSSSFNQILF